MVIVIQTITIAIQLSRSGNKLACFGNQLTCFSNQQRAGIIHSIYVVNGRTPYVTKCDNNVKQRKDRQKWIKWDDTIATKDSDILAHVVPSAQPGEPRF
jgi:hypothetical protein